jgi:Fe-S-cluster containining protein
MPKNTQPGLPAPDRPADREPDLGAAELLAGFHDLLRRTGITASSALDASALVYALADVLVGKGVLSLDELDRARKDVESRLSTDLVEKGVTVRLTDNAPDKYDMTEGTAEIDCASRLHLCHAACCRLRFALSEQDIEESIVQWSVREPYLNRQTDDGYCAHIGPDRFCGIYENRPSICRSYDCRKDSRIWVDFDARIPNAELLEATSPSRAQSTAAKKKRSRRPRE